MDEKVRIATRFLVPKQVKENGLTMDMVRIGEEAVLKVVTDYTREVSEGRVAFRSRIEWIDCSRF
jgi:ATP-dependent Lon protease